MMDSKWMFVLTLVLFAAAWGAYSLRGVDVKEYFATRTGKGILKGIVIAVVATILLALLSGCAGTYMDQASVYAGLDYTKKQSPQCEGGGPDDHSTSNIGLMLRAFQSDDDRFTTTVKYTHHSCAFGEDSRGYDALGMEMKYTLWSR